MNFVVKMIVTRVVDTLRSKLREYVEQTETDVDDKLFDFFDNLLNQIEGKFAGGPFAAAGGPDSDPLMDQLVADCVDEFASIEPDELA